MKSVLVTGATGFVGRFLCSTLLLEGWSVRGTLLASEDTGSLATGVEPVLINPFGDGWQSPYFLRKVDTIIHLAARVHVMDERSVNPLAEYRRVNSRSTQQVGRDAAEAGVKRFVFVSTIKVNGEESPIAYTEDSSARPTDPYGISKWEAEQALREIEAETGMEVVIVRPPLVYGPGVKANFLRMMKLVRAGIPLPLSSINNRRSFVFVKNLVDALRLCADDPLAAGQTYLVDDGEAISTPELLRRLAHAFDQSPVLFPFPLRLFKFMGFMTGKLPMVERLIGSLELNGSKIREELGWTPPFTMEQGLQETAAWFLKTEEQ